MGFVDMGQFVAHFLTKYGQRRNDANVHAQSFKCQRLLWTPSLSVINVNADMGSQPTYAELYFQHMNSVAQRQDHAVFMFRQFSRQPDFHGEYLQKITKIAARAAVSLQASKRGDIASAAVISSFLTRSRMMPSFAYNTPTEMELVLHKHFGGSSTAPNNIWLGLLCQNAARATFNLTNQLLRGQMRG